MDLTTDQWFYTAIVGELAVLIGILVYALLTSRRPRPQTGDADSETTNRILLWIAREPVRFRSYVVSVVGAVATALTVLLGVNLSPEQIASIVGLIVTVAVAVAEISRRAVSPVKEQS